MKYNHNDNKLNKYLDCAIYILFNDNTIENGILRKNNDSYKLVCDNKDIIFYKSQVKRISYKKLRG